MSNRRAMWKCIGSRVRIADAILTITLRAPFSPKADSIHEDMDARTERADSLAGIWYYRAAFARADVVRGDY